jgi:hypothetical protein
MPPNVALMVLPLAWWWGIVTNGNILTVLWLWLIWTVLVLIRDWNGNGNGLCVGNKRNGTGWLWRLKEMDHEGSVHGQSF